MPSTQSRTTSFLARSIFATLCLFVLVVGCSTPEPTKEVKELKTKTAEEVAYTYEAIMAMSSEDLNKNIKELSDQLEARRKNLPPSLAGMSVGSSEPETKANVEDSATELEKPISYLALPLEVMKQTAESKK